MQSCKICRIKVVADAFGKERGRREDKGLKEGSVNKGMEDNHVSKRSKLQE